jgi:hypothetical protein
MAWVWGRLRGLPLLRGTPSYHIKDKIAYVSRPFSQWGRLLYFCSKLKKYIAQVPLGYNIDLVMFFHISRTQQKK